MKYIFGYFLRGIFICFLLFISFGISHANGHAKVIDLLKKAGAKTNSSQK